MNDLHSYLAGGDLRSIAQVNQLLPFIRSQQDFDMLFQYVYADDRLMVMRAADAIEKITKDHPAFLDAHKDELIALLDQAQDKEFKWHLALLVSRIQLTRAEAAHIWHTLATWATDPAESKIVRVNALQSLYDFTKKYPHLEKDFEQTVEAVGKEHIPSINARIKRFTKGTDASKK